MKEVLSGSKAKSNEEYRKVIKNKMRIMAVIAFVGIITAAAGFLSEFYFKVSVNEKMLGIYSGLGSSLFACGAVLCIKNRRLLNNEKKLKESRLSNTDERNQEISNKALKISAYVMLIALYATGLIGGIFYPILFEVLLFMVCVFLLSYTIAYKYYNSKM